MKLFFNLLTVSGEEESLISELWKYFYSTYLNPDEYYEHLGAGSSALISVRLIIAGLFIGMMLAAFAAVFNKRVLGGVVRKMLSAGAISTENAMTLEELGYEGNPIVRYAVRKSTNLRRVVKCVEEQNFDAAQAEKYNEYKRLKAENKSAPRFKDVSYKINPYADAFYIPEEMKYMADIKFEKKGTSWLGAIIFTVIMAIAFVAVMVALPYILNVVNDIVGIVGSSET